MSSETAMPDKNDEQYELPVEEAVELARGHHLVGNYVLAERTYHDILRAVPDQPTVNHLLGAMYYQLGNTEKAIHYMKKSVELSPDEPQYWSNYGSVFTLAERNEEAIECFDQVLRLDPDNVEALNRKSITFWQSEDFKSALEVAERSLKLAPHNLDGLINKGLSLAGLQEYQKASEVWKVASDHYPEDSRIWSNWSNMQREMRKPDKAAALALKALDLDSENVDALNNLGCAYRDLGQNEEAVELFRKATNIKPKYYKAHYNMALAYADLSQYEDASIAARYAIDFKEDYCDAYQVLSMCTIELGEFDKAHFSAQRALQLKPDSADSYLNLAHVLYLSDRFDDGHAALKEALKFSPDDPRCYMQLSSIYERTDELDDALEAIDKALELAPEMPLFYARKAALLHMANESEEALVLLDKAIGMAPKFLMSYTAKSEILIAVDRRDEARETILKAQEINPESPLVYYTLASLKNFESEDDPDFKMMLKLVPKALSMGLNHAASMYYSIANSYENMKQYEKAFEYYDKANEAQRKISPFNEAREIQTCTIIKEKFIPGFFTSVEGKGCPSEVPIFIVGMPRSGTTLTEQILSAHPDVYGAGELPDIARAKIKVGSLNADSALEMGETYLEMAEARVKEGQGDYKFITDKMPGNYMNIGMIHTILPNAKIIHCCRDPLDTCLSNYRQNFLTGQFWSYNQEELGDEYLRYLDMMEYWHKVLPGRVFDIHYEDTVNDLEKQARRMLDFIGLEWNDACLEPHKQKRAILTASKGQVTKPVYKTSVEKWKRYEKQLQPLVRKLAPEKALPEEA